MEKIKRTLARWRELPATMVPLARIKTDEALQPRTMDAVSVKYRQRLTEASELHIGRMREELAAFADWEAEPLLLASCDGRLLLVDGHHRLSAYRIAGRSVVPARVLPLSRCEAVMASKLVNCGGVKLPMHPDQARDAAWQYLAQVMAQGRKPLPAGISARGVAATFGVSKSTASRMVAKVPEVNIGDFGNEAKDPGTGWPRWRFVRGNAWRDSAGDVPQEERQRAQATRLAGKLAALMDKAGPEVSRMAVAVLLAERRDEAADLLDDVLDAETGAESDY